MDNITTNVSDGVTGVTNFFDGKGADAIIHPQGFTDIGSIILMTGGEQGIIVRRNGVGRAGTLRSLKTILARGQVLVKPNVDRAFPLVVVTSIMLGNTSLTNRLWLRFLMRGSILVAKACL
jgi:hypothetical protein